MKRARKIQCWIGLLGVIVACCTIPYFFIPEYEGKSVYYWRDALRSSDRGVHQKAIVAFQKMGKRGAPYLASQINRLTSKFWTQDYPVKIYSKAPSFLKKMLPAPPGAAPSLFKALQAMGTNGAAAADEVVHALEKSSEGWPNSGTIITITNLRPIQIVATSGIQSTFILVNPGISNTTTIRLRNPGPVGPVITLGALSLLPDPMELALTLKSIAPHDQKLGKKVLQAAWKSSKRINGFSPQVLKDLALAADLENCDLLMKIGLANRPSIEVVLGHFRKMQWTPEIQKFFEGHFQSEDKTKRIIAALAMAGRPNQKPEIWLECLESMRRVNRRAYGFYETFDFTVLDILAPCELDSTILEILQKKSKETPEHAYIVSDLFDRQALDIRRQLSSSEVETIRKGLQRASLLGTQAHRLRKEIESLTTHSDKKVALLAQTIARQFSGLPRDENGRSD